MAHANMIRGGTLLGGRPLQCTSYSAVSQSRMAPKRLEVTARAGLPSIGMLGTKAGMTQIFRDGLAIPASVIAIDEGNIVTQVKTEDTDGYNAVQVGYKVCHKKKPSITKPELNHLKKSGAPEMKKLVEFKFKEVGGYSPGQQLKVDEIFKVGDMVDVAGKSIGKGFQGTIKRWNMRRGPMTHGSKSKRQRGSIGSSATPARVFPGLKMAGQMGNERKKIRQLEVLVVDAELNAIVVKGAIPGKAGNTVEILPAKVVGKNC
jgi:large subunit ribosomal protein L3